MRRGCHSCVGVRERFVEGSWRDGWGWWELRGGSKSRVSVMYEVLFSTYMPQWSVEGKRVS